MDMNIPSPLEYEHKQFTTIAGFSFALKYALIAALKQGQTSVAFTVLKDRPEIIKLTEKDFNAAGWRLVDNGESISLSPRRS